MVIYFCASCGATVPEKNIKSGTAVRVDEQTVHCFRCITSRVAKVSDSKVYRALLAHNAENKLRNAVKSVSRRLIAQVPDGRVKRFVTRVSERIFPRTAQYARIGSSPRNPRPPGSSAAIRAVTERRTEANNLALATIACVVLAIGTLIIFMAFGKKAPQAQNNVEKPDTKVAANAAPVTEPALKATPAAPEKPQYANILQQPATQRPQTPAGTNKPDSSGARTVMQVPPTLAERAEGNFKDDIATERLNQIVASYKARTIDEAGYQKQLDQLANTYRGTKAAEEAVKLMKSAQPPAPPKAAEGLDWFASWQVDNLYKNAKAKMYEEFDGRAFVLETHPPESGKPLILKWNVTVPADKPFFEFSVRSGEKSDCAMLLEIDGKKAPVENIDESWKALVVDLSAMKGRQVTVVLNHLPTGWENETAFWQAPHLVGVPDKSAKILSVSDKSTETMIVAENWNNAIDLLSIIEPARDSVAGTWRMQDGALVAEKALFGRIEIPYQPPQEYDLRVVFSRRDGNDAVTQILSRNGRSFGWTMGAANNTVFGFETVGGVSAAANPTTVKNAAGLENGRKYTALVKVRAGGVKAWLDGKMISEWKTDYSDLDIYADWKLRDPALLGLGSWNSTTFFHKVEILEVSGKGTVRAESRPQQVSDIKLEYERTLAESYKLLATTGVKAALQRVEQARAIPAMAPIGAKLALDAECFSYVQDARDAALAGAKKLADGRAYTFVKADGRQINVGGSSGNAVKEVAGEVISIEQTVGTAKAIVRVEVNELAAETQAELARLALPPATADLKLSVPKLAKLALARNDAIGKEVKRSLESAAKDPALAAKAEHLASHLAFLDRDSDLAERFKAFEALCRAAKWREAKTAAEEINAEFANSFALERIKPAMAPWMIIIEREAVSPLLKR